MGRVPWGGVEGDGSWSLGWAGLTSGSEVMCGTQGGWATGIGSPETAKTQCQSRQGDSRAPALRGAHSKGR